MSKLLVTTMWKGQGVVAIDTDDPKNYQHLFKNLYPIGICQFDKGFLVADRWYGIFILDNNLNIVENYTEGIGEQLHDILLIDNKIYTVNTDKNKIDIIDLNSGKFLDDIRIFRDTTEDVHHLNSFKLHKDKFYLSVFSWEGNKNRNYDDSGAIVTIDPKTHRHSEIIHYGLTQPHTLHFIEDDMYYMDSMEKKVFKNKNVVLNTEMYARGFAHDENYLYVGQSNERHREQSGQHTTSCNVSIYDHQFNFVTKIDLPSYEIYDIIVVK